MSPDGADVPPRRPSGALVYVGNLPPEFEEEDLQRVFVKFGALLGIELLKGPESMSAFITFRDPAAAASVVAEMHEQSVAGRVLKVRLARHRGAGGGRPLPHPPAAPLDGPEDDGEPSPRRVASRTAAPAGAGRDLVCANCRGGGHHYRDCPEEYRCALCGENTHIARFCRLRGRAQGPARRRREDRPPAASIACYNCGLRGHKYDVCPRPRVCLRCGQEGHTSNVCRNDDNPSRTLKCTGLPVDTREDGLRELFRSHGPLHAILFTKVPAKNYGFVYFAGPKKERHAERAIRRLNGQKVKGSRIRVRPAEKAGAEPDSREILFVGNLDLKVTERDVWRLFSKYSSVDYAWVHLPTMEALVEFTRAVDAKRAIQDLQGAEYRGSFLHFLLVDDTLVADAEALGDSPSGSESEKEAEEEEEEMAVPKETAKRRAAEPKRARDKAKDEARAKRKKEDRSRDRRAEKAQTRPKEREGGGRRNRPEDREKGTDLRRDPSPLAILPPSGPAAGAEGRSTERAGAAEEDTGHPAPSPMTDDSLVDVEPVSSPRSPVPEPDPAPEPPAPIAAAAAAVPPAAPPSPAQGRGTHQEDGVGAEGPEASSDSDSPYEPPESPAVPPTPSSAGLATRGPPERKDAPIKMETEDPPRKLARKHSAPPTKRSGRDNGAPPKAAQRKQHVSDKKPTSTHAPRKPNRPKTSAGKTAVKRAARPKAPHGSRPPKVKKEKPDEAPRRVKAKVAAPGPTKVLRQSQFEQAAGPPPPPVPAAEAPRPPVRAPRPAESEGEDSDDDSPTDSHASSVASNAPPSKRPRAPPGGPPAKRPKA